VDPIERAKRTALDRDAILELGRSLGAVDYAAIIEGAVRDRRTFEACILALAARVIDRPVSIQILRPVLRYAGSLLIPVALATTGNPVRTLLEDIEDGLMEGRLGRALAAVAAAYLGPPSDRLIAQLRRARRQLRDPMDAFDLALAVMLVDCGEAVLPAPVPIPHDVIDLFRAARSDPLVLIGAESDRAPTAIAHTVEREGPKVGRNDPCPCGSGKKYKRCCGPLGDAVGPAFTKRFAPDQLRRLPAEELRLLDLEGLDEVGLRVVANRAISERLWFEAEHALQILETRGVVGVDAYRVDLIECALHEQDLEVAERGLARIRDRSLVTPQLELQLTVFREAPDTLAKISELLERTLDDPRDPGPMTLAFALLDRYPALGIAVGRGTLRPSRAFDAELMLEEIEIARNRLGLDPVDEWWEVLDREDSGDDVADEEEEEPLEEDARLAEENARLAAEINEKRDELRRLRNRLNRSAPAEGAPQRDAAERDRLRSKIDELEGLIREGQSERRALRHQLAEARRDPSGAPAKAVVLGEDEATGGDREAAPEGWSIPVFADDARRDLERLPARIAAKSIRAAAAVAASDPSAWRQVKKLEAGGGLRSARVGIHHRILFALGGGRLDVLRVVDREDFDTALANLGRRRTGPSTADTNRE
jgi:hypothetical protein